MAARFTDEAWADRADKRPPGTSLNARGLGRPREQATARHTPGCARPRPAVRTPQRWHTGRCARPRPTARTSDRPAHPGARGRGLSCARPNGGTPEDARGRGRPRGAPREGRARPGRCSWARCVNTTPEYAVRLVALGPRPRVGAPAPRRDSRQTSFHPDARERASQKARYWPSACE